MSQHKDGCSQNVLVYLTC